MAKIKIENLKVGTNYKFYIVARGESGIESAPSNIYSFTTVGDTTAPDAVTALGTDFNTSTFNASWSGTAAELSTDFLDYKILLYKPGTSPSYTYYTRSTNFALTIDENRNLFGTPSPSITVSVYARDTSGNLSSAVSTTTANPPPTVVPSASFDFSTRDLFIDWTPVSSSTDVDVAGYIVRLFNSAAASTASFTISGKDSSKFSFSFENNGTTFGTPRPTFTASINTFDVFGQLSSACTTTVTNPPPSQVAAVTASSVLKGFSASWTAASFSDYAYSKVFTSATTPFSACAGGGVEQFSGDATTYSYVVDSLYNPIYIQVLYYDVFNQPSPNSNTASVTPIPPIVVDNVPPTNATGLTVTASNSGGATELNGYIIASWTESVDTSMRGARLRIRAQGDNFYQFENSASGTASYQINGLIPGYTYEVAIASYDEINNTSSFTLASPSAITIPYGTTPSISISASSVAGQRLLATGTTTSAYIGQLVSGWGIRPGTRITAASGTSSAVISQPTASTFSGSVVTFYPGIADWESYVTAGASMRFGTGVSGAQSGIWLDNNNYWYTSGNLRVGSNSSFIGWDGTTASITGDLRAFSGSFFGNVKIGSGGALYAGTNPDSGARVIFSSSGLIGYNSGGTNTFVIDSSNGNISASSGYIGGWTITSSSLSTGTSGSTVGLALVSSSTDVAIWAGNAVRSSAPFRVTAAGNASFSNAYLSGSLSSTSGSIGAFFLGASGIYSAANELTTDQLSASIVSANITASNTLYGLGNFMYLRATGSASKPQIYLNNVVDTTNYSNININAGQADGALEIYRRFDISSASVGISSVVYDAADSSASIFTAQNPSSLGVRAGQLVLLVGLPSRTPFTITASNVRNFNTNAASFSGNSASWPGTGSTVYVGDFVLSPGIAGSAVKISSIQSLPVYDTDGNFTGSLVYTGALSSTVTGSLTVAASFMSSNNFVVITSASPIEVGDYVSFTASVARSQVSAYAVSGTSSIVTLGAQNASTPASAAFSGATTLTLRQNPDFSSFNSNNSNVSGSLYYSIDSVVEGVSSSYIVVSRYPADKDGMAIVSGSQSSITGASIVPRKVFSGKITTAPFYAQDGHILLFSHDQGNSITASTGWPSRNDYGTGGTVTRIIEPNILTRSTVGTIEMNGSWMSDGISKVVLGDGFNNYGAELVSWYDTYVGSIISKISMYGHWSNYSSFWTGSSVKAGRLGMQLYTSQGPNQTTTTVSGVSGTTGNNFITVASTSSSTFVVGAEIVGTNNTAASGIGSANQIVSACTNGTTASVFLNYALSSGFTSQNVQVYVPDRRKMEFNSTGNIYMQSEEDITLQATRFFGAQNVTLAMYRSSETLFMDAKKYTLGNGYFKSGIDIEPQSGWVNTASPYITIVPFDNFGTRINTNALSYNDFEQSWMAGDKTNTNGNGIRLKVERYGIGANNAGVIIGRKDGTRGLGYIDFYTNGGTSRSARIIAASTTNTSSEKTKLSINAASVAVNDSSANDTVFADSGAVVGEGNSWAAPWRAGPFNTASYLLRNTGAALASAASVYYQQIGRTVHARYIIDQNTASTVYTGTYFLRFPVNALSNQDVIGTARIMRGGTSPFVGVAVANTTTTFSLNVYAGVTSGAFSTWTNSVPAGQGTTDFIYANITYEAESDA